MAEAACPLGAGATLHLSTLAAFSSARQRWLMAKAAWPLLASQQTTPLCSVDLCVPSPGNPQCRLAQNRKRNPLQANPLSMATSAAPSNSTHTQCNVAALAFMHSRHTKMGTTFTYAAARLTLETFAWRVGRVVHSASDLLQNGKQQVAEMLKHVLHAVRHYERSQLLLSIRSLKGGRADRVAQHGTCRLHLPTIARKLLPALVRSCTHSCSPRYRLLSKNNCAPQQGLPS